MRFMKTTLAACAVGLLLLAGCEGGGTQGTPGTISGQITGLEAGDEVVLRTFKNKNLINVGRTTLAEDGSFSLTPDNALKMGYHQLLVAKSYPLVLIADSTEGVHVTAKAFEGNNYLIDAQISGSPGSVVAKEYYDSAMPLQRRMKDLERRARIGSAKDKQALKEEMAAKRDSMEALGLAFVNANKTHPASLSALEGLDPKEHKDLFKEVLDGLKEDYGDSYFYGVIRELHTRANRPRKLDLNAQSKKSSKNAKFSQGDMAPDIVMNDPDGNERSLSALRGKVVLLDFWASWCGPCRRENPNVVRAYQKYKDQGFEVFSVSLDSDVNRWKAAIEQDQLAWPNHVSDLAGWRNAAAREYGISSIPHTMLIDRDGSILATHLRGGGVESALRGIFEK